MERRQQQQQQQRGLCGRGADGHTMRLSITSTTGCPVELTVPRGETVEGLRTRISQKLRLQRNRTVLLHKDRQLTAGKLLDLGVADGSKLTLVPVIEAGLVCSTARAERTMMDVLESLTESQISDFLSGHSPLTINLGIGAHVMYVQLQLSAQDVRELQRDRDARVQGSSELQSGLPPAGSTSHPGSASATSPASQTSSPAPESADSTSHIQLSTQGSRTSLNSTAPTPCTSTSVPTVNRYQHSSLPQPCHSIRTPPTVLSTAPLPSGRPRPSCPLQAATPVCSPAPTGSSPGPPSPVPASTFNTPNDCASATEELCRQPGAVIESFVNHSPGVFSGTFSGSLAPHSHTDISHPRRGIGIILQILSDLLRAACHHQEAPPTLSQGHCPALNLPVGPVLTAEEPSKARSKPLEAQRAEHFSKATGEERRPLGSSTEEDHTLHCKLEHLQSLMHQRRLRRRTRRNSQTSRPYQHCQHQP
ncbi:midnolin-like [Scophthalmus maximus]|uniref:midnolin-like n=1 Tax=Scophthalmus maximus TaxID=52904 RepID=UPI001FA90BD5|nr:midnolin-like [Scophthalmus maximus]